MLSPQAHGQTTDSEEVGAPQMTVGAPGPASRIANSKRPQFAPLGMRDVRSIMMSAPDTALEVAPVALTSRPLAVSPSRLPAKMAPAIKPDLSAGPKPILDFSLPNSPATATKMAPIRIAALPPDQLTPLEVPPLPVIPAATMRGKAASLPARGGLRVDVAQVEVSPSSQPTDSVGDSDRLLLARLDADLERAQRRLNRAETNLSEGQRQLGDFTSVLRSAMLDAGDDARGLHPFVRVAQRYLGTPYVWGGESARGFDCSGFIMRVMRDLGYQALPHSAAEQFNYGTPIAKPLLKAGDIVFFANTYKPGISHVGIYLGKGRFIHAANSHVGTIVSSLNEPKWVEKYAGARRLLQASS